MDRILNMIVRRVVGRLVNKGMDAGFDAVARSRAGGNRELDGAERANARTASRQARGVMRMARRFGRF